MEDGNAGFTRECDTVHSATVKVQQQLCSSRQQYLRVGSCVRELLLRMPLLMAESQGASSSRVASSCLGEQLGCRLVGNGMGELVHALLNGSGNEKDAARAKSCFCTCCPSASGHFGDSSGAG